MIARLGMIGWLTLLVLPSAVAAPRTPVTADAVAPEIDRIEFTGVSVLTEQSIQSAIEIAVGDRPDRRRIIRSAESLQALYHANGYEQVQIETRLSREQAASHGGASPVRSVLTFAVTEGEPTRVDHIRIRGDGVRADDSQVRWQSLQGSLHAKVAFLPGDILIQERVANSRRQLVEALALKEYVGPRVDDVKIVTSARQGGGAARWVDVEFVVTPGDRVSFGFRGNEALSASHLLSLIEEQRLLGLGRDYVSAIRARVEEEYRSLGYAKATAVPYKVERSGGGESHVTFVITEGPRVLLGAIEFDGNEDFSPAQLTEKFRAAASLIVKQGYYVERDVQKSAELVVEWMKSRGYLSAKLVTINTRFVPSTRAGDRSVKADLTIYVYEWDQTVVQSVAISGHPEDPALMNAAAIKGALGLREGEPLNLFAFSRGLEDLKSYYRNHGYLEVKILNEGTDQVVRYTDENRFADIRIELSPGPRYRVSRILIEGLTFTREEVIRRELRFAEGEVLEEWRIRDTEARLRRLGIFSVVTLRVSEDVDRPGHKIIRVSIQEGSPGLVGGGLGYRNDLGVRAFGGVSYGNLWGKNHTLAFDLSTNRRLEPIALELSRERNITYLEYEGRVSYTWPWFGLGETTFRPSLAVSAIAYRLFDATTTSLSLAWERRLLANPNLSASITYSLERVRQFNAIDEENGTPSQVDNQTLTIGSITPAFRLDLRDNPLAPTSGFMISGSAEIAAPWLLSSGRGVKGTGATAVDLDFPVGYTRSQLRTDLYLPVGLGIVGYLSFRMGFERSTESPLSSDIDDPSGAIPLIKQFALGGIGSLRGFQEQELNYQSKIIRGTLAYVNYRAQLDLPFAGALHFGPFLDAANLTLDSFSFGGLRWGTGFGFRYLTPVGPVNLDFGFKINPPPGEKDLWNIYFSIGVI